MVCGYVLLDEESVQVLKGGSVALEARFGQGWLQKESPMAMLRLSYDYHCRGRQLAHITDEGNNQAAASIIGCNLVPC